MSIEIRQKVSDLREKIESLKAQKDDIENSLLPKSEVIERAHELITSNADRFIQDELQYRLSNLLNAGGNPHSAGLFKLSLFTMKDIDQSHDIDLGGLLCCLLGDQIRDGLTKAIEGLPYDEGLPAPERPAKTKQLDGEIMKLEREEEAMIVKAESMGLSIARHPDANPRVILECEEAA